MKLLDSLSYDPVLLSFGTSGLRGLAVDMTDLECYINTLGFLDFLKAQKELRPADQICIAGDLRESTPRILNAVVSAVLDNGFEPIYCGLIPTPALAYYAQEGGLSCVMVTGSHIPANRNGIKFYKVSGEVMKEDEAQIKGSVAKARVRIYNLDSELAGFDPTGTLVRRTLLPELEPAAEKLFFERYVSNGTQMLRGKHIIVYEHSAVGRDLLCNILEALGAKVTRVGRSDVFISIDTENVTPDNKTYFREIAAEYPDNFAIVSADGDSDRPFVIDEKGEFHRGDVVGCLVADILGADFAANPISCNDSVDVHLGSEGVKVMHTRIGSPYVLKAMYEAINNYKKIMGWEVNGGFMTYSELELNGMTLKPLPTRDAFLPILAVLSVATQKGMKLSELFATLPARFTGGGLLDNVDENAIQMLRSMTAESKEIPRLLEIINSEGYGEVESTDFTDGIRLRLKSGDIIHVRPSGNAPQLRIYTNCDSQEQADQLATNAVREGGLLEKISIGITEPI